LIFKNVINVGLWIMIIFIHRHMEAVNKIIM